MRSLEFSGALACSCFLVVEKTLPIRLLIISSERARERGREREREAGGGEGRERDD